MELKTTVYVLCLYVFAQGHLSGDKNDSFDQVIKKYFLNISIFYVGHSKNVFERPYFILRLSIMVCWAF